MVVALIPHTLQDVCMWNGCWLLPLVTFLSLDIFTPNVAHTKPLACCSDIHSLDLRWWYIYIYIYIYMSNFSFSKERGKGYLVFSIFPNFQLEEGTPLCCFTSSCPSPQIGSMIFWIGWMDGWMNDSLKISECRYLLWWPHGSWGFYNQGSWRIHVPSSDIYSHGSQTFEKV